MVNVGYGDDGPEAHLRMLAVDARLDRGATRSDYRQIDTVDDIAAARAAGQLAVGFDIEGANAIDDQLSLLGLYRDLGVRWMLLAYNRNNRAGGGCQDDDPGLTDFGRQMLHEMARVGIVACCSHTGYRTAREAIDESPTPVIFSHSNARALADHPRNIPDDLIRACAARGGVVGVNGIGIFLGNNDSSVGNVARHVLHMLDLVGPEHVGLGLDYIFDSSELAARDRRQPRQVPAAPGLLRRHRDDAAGATARSRGGAVAPRRRRRVAGAHLRRQLAARGGRSGVRQPRRSGGGTFARRRVA